MYITLNKLSIERYTLTIFTQNKWENFKNLKAQRESEKDSVRISEQWVCIL